MVVAQVGEVLIRRVWGEEGRGNVEALRSAVAKLRRKLGDDARKPRYVIGVRNLGYRMPEPDGARGRPKPSREPPPCRTRRGRTKGRSNGECNHEP